MTEMNHVQARGYTLMVMTYGRLFTRLRNSAHARERMTLLLTMYIYNNNFPGLENLLEMSFHGLVV